MTTDDERWALAATIQLTPATDTADSETLDSGHHGVITARPHPTGWFISARHRPGLSSDELHDFAEFVRVRTYLLLTDGPCASTWERNGSDGFVAWCKPSGLMAEEWIAA